MEGSPPDDEAASRRRAEELRRAVEGMTGGGAGDRPRPAPRSPHEFVKEQMREEAERVETEGGDEPDEEEP
jgi:hypothetical protein